jgi:hypothetical protein
MDLIEIRYELVEWIEVAMVTDQWQVLVNTVMNLVIKVKWPLYAP